MGIDANDIQFFLQEVASLVAYSCLTFVRQYPLVFFAFICLLFFDLFLPGIVVFVFHSFPIFVTIVVSTILLLDGRSAKNTSICELPVVVETKKTLQHENSFTRQNVNYDSTRENDYKNIFDKTSEEENNDDTKETRGVNHRETFSPSSYERLAPMLRHNVGGSKEFNKMGAEQSVQHSDDRLRSEGKMDLKNLLLSEMERNRRLESLTAKRRARKLLSMQVRNTLLNMGKNNSPNIGSIHIPKANPLLSHNPAFVSPTPGSAPSVLLPMHNPFLIPYDTNEEKSGNATFRRGDSFNLSSFLPSPTSYDQQRHLNSCYDEETSPCIPLMNEAENEMPMKVEVEGTSRETSLHSKYKRDIEMGRGNNELGWVASSHLNNIEENESRSREVHEVSNQDIIDVGFSSILNHKADDIVGQDLTSIKSEKEEDRDVQHAMYDVSDGEDNIYTKLSTSEKSPMNQNSSDEENTDDMFMESMRKLTTPKASQTTTILKERLANRLSRDDTLECSPRINECIASTSQFLDPEIEQRIILGPVPSPKSVLQANLSTLSTSSLDHDAINFKALQPGEMREFGEHRNGIDSSISIKIEQESSNPNQEFPTDEIKGGSNSNTIIDEPYVLVEPSDIGKAHKDVEIAHPSNSIEDAKQKSTENIQMIDSEDPLHNSANQLRIEIT
ncbi:uncharacterized protein LOC124943539 [Impatiens glandulifera]|uniref:uncharacterized protein LOC124943539 n=1 Tax=Impatiens glandulifera TaxID=253017 RepID=UPI001FB110C0|nr:uncharacterized protein LOC124943539 [Impatiens glandulifera]